MRIWFDMTASAHPVVFRPVIARLREQGDEVQITARDYSQTLELLDMLGLEHLTIGRHAGASRSRKALALAQRTGTLYRWVRRQSFDLAVGHGSNDLALVAKWAGIPAVNMFDYEFAIQQHNIGCRLATRVITPDAIPPSRRRGGGGGGGERGQ
jgi:predicted glycosyltransferase